MTRPSTGSPTPSLEKSDNVAAMPDSAMDAGGGVLRLTPTWVPRSFLHPGKRIRLHPDDYYSFGAERGGIDERWFSSTTEAANEGRTVHEGLSFCLFGDKTFLLRDAVSEAGPRLIGESIWNKYKKWPVFSKFFDNMGPIPHHMHQSHADAALVGQEGKPESYFFSPQYNNCDNNFPHTFMGLEPGTTKDQLRKCLADWDNGENGILDLSKAYRLKRGTGWLIPPGVLHAPGSLCTYEPQWGSDVFGMYQNIVEGRYVPWSLLVKDMPAEKHDDLDFIVDQLDWEKNIDPPVWPGTVGASSMTTAEDRKLFVSAVEKACRIARIFNEHGVRKYGVIRVDSADRSIASWAEDPAGNTTKIAATFKEAAKVAADHGERLAAEGEVCWCGMHSWRDMLDLLEAVGMPDTLGFQADLAHTYLYLLGVNAPERALLKEGYSKEQFDAAYKQMTDALRPWTIDFHVAQNDGTVHGSGSHDKTGRHCPADDPNGKLDVVECSKYWLEGAGDRGMKHICWDGCMFPNAMLEEPSTWNTILDTMIKVREARGASQ